MLLRKPAETPWVEHVRHCNRIIARTRRLFQLPDWPTRALRAVHGWHGHLARCWGLATGLLEVDSDSAPTRALAWEAWIWRSEGWWRTIQALRLHESTVDANTTHPRRGAVVQHSEHNSCLVFGWDWATRAADRQLWRADRGIFEHNMLAYWHKQAPRKRAWKDLGLDRAGTARRLRRRLVPT